MRTQAIVSDVDGTLLTSQQRLSPGVEAAVKEAAARGVPVGGRVGAAVNEAAARGVPVGGRVGAAVKEAAARGVPVGGRVGAAYTNPRTLIPEQKFPNTNSWKAGLSPRIACLRLSRQSQSRKT